MAIKSPIVQVEIRVRSLERAVAYYNQVFDWNIQVVAPNSYAVCDTGHLPIVGLMQTANPDVPTGVVAYVGTDDAEAAARRAEAEGARILMPKAVEGAGTWSHIVDPWGNELAFWQSNYPNPKLVGSRKNRLSWMELRAPDLPTSVRFYNRVCGWDFQIMPNVDDFAFCSHPQRAVGIGLVGGERANHLREVTVYAEVPNVLDTTPRVEAAGGSVSGQVGTAPEGRRFRIMRDLDDNPMGLVEPGAFA